MNSRKRLAAEVLARNHCEVEPNLTCAFLIESTNEDDPNEPIKLLEVVEGTIERGIEPVAFTADPDRGLDYPSMIVEVSPGEYERIRLGGLDLGRLGWKLGEELARNN